MTGWGVSVAVAVMVVVIVACGGTDTAATTIATGPASTTTSTTELAAATTTTVTASPGFEVVSEDGLVTLEVPVDAMADDPGIAITVLAPEDYPAPLTGAAQNPGAVLYRLEPAALTLDVPARLTRTFSASNFEDLPPTGIPLITLIVYTPDSGFEQLEVTSIVREGDEVRVSADIAHFSTLVAVFERQYAEVDFAPTLGSQLEVDETYTASISYFDKDDNPLDPPAEVIPSGFSRTDQVLIEASLSDLDVTCFEKGDYDIGFRWDVVVPTGDGVGESGFGLRSTPLLTENNDVQPAIRLKLAALIACSDEPDVTGLAGQNAAVETTIDHPGGNVNAQGEDFNGGLSAVIVKMVPGTLIPNMQVGLIQDTNENGVIDSADRIFSPFDPTITGTVGDCYVLPINEFGDFFLYAIDGSLFDEVGTGTSSLPLDDGLALLSDAYEGDGDFEDEVVVPMLGDLPLVGHAFASEDTQTAETELVVIVTARLIDPTDS